MRRLALILALLALGMGTASANTEVLIEKGVASMYAASFIGHKTASGTRLNAHELTAAHPRLPFGTKIIVTNRRNGRKVVVTVNDRGPHKKGRIIDLSPAAAAKLGMTRDGIVPVTLQIALH